jgi:hypothetical protein
MAFDICYVLDYFIFDMICNIVSICFWREAPFETTYHICVFYVLLRAAPFLGTPPPPSYV